ncbi:hypothetical protein GCM10010168_35810 [Actinoplanes ianthinogenes]|uniref:Aminoglycoside phosphotransferase domain-containing protein n=1 Tax=Actinoplanes ianthinogenes TaxID=122358 RepID=A0ABM7M5T3_9ACTN|nr:phosphotransferase [Actinoplanes ianthinogenes]BCJ46899.1 hypothetical protein Aiant_75560 [Actinoplanes ianthinogenes]GGR14779.1 hypothetical protein GCM10010168_35810 [Actinoplanes ianthinogenes]
MADQRVVRVQLAWAADGRGTGWAAVLRYREHDRDLHDAGPAAATPEQLITIAAVAALEALTRGCVVRVHAGDVRPDLSGMPLIARHQITWTPEPSPDAERAAALARRNLPGTGERCLHDLLRGQCFECRPRTDGYPARVATTDGGSVFHVNSECPALLDGWRKVTRRGGTPGRSRLAAGRRRARGRTGRLLRLHRTRVTVSVPDPEVCARWRLVAGPLLSARSTYTWAATRDGRPYILQRLDPAGQPDWGYPLRVAAALRERGWPTPEPAEEPWITPDGVWLLTHRLPGRPLVAGGADSPGQQRRRGRLLAEVHAALATAGITEQRGGFREPVEVLADPELERVLRAYEKLHPDDGALLLAGREATLAWFAANPADAAPRGVLHGDFAPWNLLFEDGRLTGVLDFEASHRSLLVADFALSWRGYQDAVISGYHEVRPLSELERRLIVPTYHAWLFLGLAGADPTTVDLSWNAAHLRRRSAR